MATQNQEPQPIVGWKGAYVEFYPEAGAMVVWSHGQWQATFMTPESLWTALAQMATGEFKAQDHWTVAAPYPQPKWDEVQKIMAEALTDGEAVRTTSATVRVTPTVQVAERTRRERIRKLNIDDLEIEL